MTEAEVITGEPPLQKKVSMKKQMTETDTNQGKPQLGLKLRF